MKQIDISGVRFGLWTAIKRLPPVGVSSRWLCVCDCGTEKSVSMANLRNGATQSCGCAFRAAMRKRNTTHGLAGTFEYRVWSGIKTRCENPRHRSYKWYGAIGVKMCEEWKDFTCFLSDVGNAPSRSHSLDRINPAGDYEKSNCRWALQETQANNKRTTIYITHDGQTRPVKEWAAITGLPHAAIRERVNNGWGDSEALTTPVRAKRNSSRKWSAKTPP